MSWAHEFESTSRLAVHVFCLSYLNITHKTNENLKDLRLGGCHRSFDLLQ
jgi:hypothetical protein